MAGRSTGYRGPADPGGLVVKPGQVSSGLPRLSDLTRAVVDGTETHISLSTGPRSSQAPER
jgi:hypothetical protein